MAVPARRDSMPHWPPLNGEATVDARTATGPTRSGHDPPRGGLVVNCSVGTTGVPPWNVLFPLILWSKTNAPPGMPFRGDARRIAGCPHC